ncbi:MAG: GGDEF domain-containing protein [Terracidiphilus sp.]
MISLKRYLESAESEPGIRVATEDAGVLGAITSAYRSALSEMGSCSLVVSPGLGTELQHGLEAAAERLSSGLDPHAITAAEGSVRSQLQGWGRAAARHDQQKTEEVKEILLLMARTAESLGERDQRASKQIDEVTIRLMSIADLDDLTKIRASIEKSALDLKISIDRITAEGKAVIERLQVEVSTYQAKLEEAEYIASCDALTGLSSRLWVEAHLQRQIDKGAVLCAVIIDIDNFKRVNDRYGHMVGDDLLKQFAAELRSACRRNDILGRWGGDEFLVLLDCSIAEARAHIERLREWICGNYTVQARSGSEKISVNASIGFAEFRPGDTIKDLLDRADAQMYENKPASRALASRPKS